MECPACNAKVPPGAWICERCDHILDTSFLNEDLDVHEEKTGLLDWAVTSQLEDPPDAVILGDVDVNENEFAVVTGLDDDEHSHSSTFVYYAAENAASLIQPDAVPNRSGQAVGFDSPYERRLLSAIDGRKSVREIQKETGLDAKHVVVGLMALMEQGGVHITSASASAAGPRTPRGARIASTRPTHLASTKEESRAPTARSTRATRTATVRAKSAVRGSTRRVDPRAPTPALSLAPDPMALNDGEPPTALDLDPESNLRTQALDLHVGPSPARAPVIPDDFDELPSISDVEEVLVEPSTAARRPALRGITDGASRPTDAARLHDGRSTAARPKDARGFEDAGNFGAARSTAARPERRARL